MNFLRRERVVKLTRTPEEFFVKEQLCLVAYEFLIRARKMVLSRADITDSVVNILGLIADMSGKSIPAAHVSQRGHR